MHGFLYTDKVEFHVIELPKLPKGLTGDMGSLELWGRFIGSERKEDFDMLAKKDPYIESAYERLQVISQDRQKRLEYEAREKALRDYEQFLYEAEQRGIHKGIQAIVEDGLEDGLPEEKILARLQRHFGLTHSEAVQHYRQAAKNNSSVQP